MSSEDDIAKQQASLWKPPADIVRGARVQDYDALRAKADKNPIAF